MKTFVGLPGWALALVMFIVGALLYMLGLKVEPDWPEAIGAFCIAASATWFEIIIGWSKFDIGGMFVIPVPDPGRDLPGHADVRDPQQSLTR